MKKLVFVAAAMWMVSSAFGITTRVHAGGEDACKSYFSTQVGAELTYETYNAKDKLQSTEIFSVKSVADRNDTTVIDVYLKGYEKGKEDEGYEMDMAYFCVDGKFIVPLDYLNNPSITEGMEGAEVTMTQTGLVFPNEMKVGTELPDGNMTMTINMAGMEGMGIMGKMTMKFDFVDRKVEAVEEVTTPAGTFNCMKFTQTLKMSGMGGMMKSESTSISWLAENVGSVKSEIYKANGKLESKQLLIGIKNN